MQKNNIKLILLILILFINNFSYCDNKIINKYHKLEVKLSGLEPKLTNTIQNNLLIQQATQETKLTKTRIENLHDQTTDDILANLQALGYYHAKVPSAKLTRITANQWQATYNIILGPAIIIKDIKIIMNNTTLTPKTNLQINKQFTHSDYEQAKQDILEELHNNGFLDAYFAKSIANIDLKAKTAYIIFEVQANQQYYLGQVTFEIDSYPDDFLNKYIPFKLNDKYNIEAINKLKNNLLNSGLFNKIRIDVDHKKAINNAVPITVRLYAKPANTYTGSMGFGTDTGIRGSLGLLRRRVNHPGHQISLNALAARIKKSITADYSWLGKDPTIDKYNLNLAVNEENIKDRNSRNAIIFIQKTKNYPNRSQGWRLNFLTESFKEQSVNNRKNSKFLFPSLSLMWLRSNTKFKNNNKFSINLKLASKVSSSTNMMQLLINDKFIQPLGLGFKLTAKGSLGFTTINDFNKLPLSLRFFAGGDYSVRGFSYQSLQPSNSIGGKHLILASLELEKIIYKDFSAAYFIDWGNALNNLNKLRYNSLAVANGIGLSYKTPIGAIKACIAKPIQLPVNNNNLKNNIRFHLIIDAGI